MYSSLLFTVYTAAATQEFQSPSQNAFTVMCFSHDTWHALQAECLLAETKHLNMRPLSDAYVTRSDT